MDGSHPACRDFVGVVEDLLARRRADLHPAAQASWNHDGWGPRMWTRTELEDIVYSSYKQMRRGRITRPPRREIVMDIADYLGCTLDERNRLLLAADAAPIAPYLTGAELQAVIRIAQEVAEPLPMPAIIINRDWHVHYLNDYMLALFNVTSAQLAALEPDQLNVLHLLFDPDLPLYEHLIENRESWIRMVRQTLYGFKLANMLSRFEPWYCSLVEQLMQLPEFEAHWESVHIDEKAGVDLQATLDSPTILLEIRIHQPVARTAWVRPLLVSVGYFQFDFPQIVAFVPADATSRATFHNLHIPGS